MINFNIRTNGVYLNSEAGQTLTETCYYMPHDPDNQSCSTDVTWTADRDKDDDGGTTTIWPGEVSFRDTCLI